MRYKFYLTVESITEHKEKYDWKKDENGKTTYRERSHGWYIRFRNSSAIGPFSDKPEFNPGDSIPVVLG